MAKKKGDTNVRTEPRSIENRRAKFDYEFIEMHEAGIALLGSEAKSVWLGRLNLVDAYCKIQGRELWLVNLDIEPYVHAAGFEGDRRRDRKLLMHKREIDRLDQKVKEKGLAIVPAKIYFKNGKAKVLIALARGKRQYDKRQQIAEKEKRREIEQVRSRRLRRPR